MKIVRIDGGLGNQMFCYAFAIALAEASGEEVLLDTHRYKFYPNHNGYELPEIFDVKFQDATMRQLWKVTYPAKSVLMSRIFYRLPHRRSEIVENYCKCYPDIFKNPRDGYYIGCWQWYKYFDNIREKVFSHLSFKKPLVGKNLELYRQIKGKDNTVSIHIRRGDYLTTPDYCNICDLDYYSRAISLVRERLGSHCHFVIFSNDMVWCSENIKPLLPDDEVTMVDWNKGIESYNDIRLMSACRVNIVANSSFSWWGAYMNSRSDKMVIAPNRWINRPLEYRIQCYDWICI